MNIFKCVADEENYYEFYFYYYKDTSSIIVRILRKDGLPITGFAIYPSNKNHNIELLNDNGKNFLSRILKNKIFI